MRIRELPLEECLSEAQRMYPPPTDNGATWHICLPNHKGRRLNNDCQRRLAAQIPESEKIWVESVEACYEISLQGQGSSGATRP